MTDELAALIRAAREAVDWLNTYDDGLGGEEAQTNLSAALAAWDTLNEADTTRRLEVKATEDIAPLASIAEREFDHRWQAAYSAVKHLEELWEELYGPSEIALPIIGQLEIMSQEFFSEDES